MIGETTQKERKKQKFLLYCVISQEEIARPPSAAALPSGASKHDAVP
jgi:hypothetical protein